MATFTWIASTGASLTIRPIVRRVAFGDGYEQRSALGINTEVVSWTLSFTGNSAKISPIRAFLRAQGAVISFQWTSPLNELGIYVCREFTLNKPSSAIMQVTAKFDRVYEANI